LFVVRGPNIFKTACALNFEPKKKREEEEEGKEKNRLGNIGYRYGVVHLRHV